MDPVESRCEEKEGKKKRGMLNYFAELDWMWGVDCLELDHGRVATTHTQL
jgi:hypothetical protein